MEQGSWRWGRVCAVIGIPILALFCLIGGLMWGLPAYRRYQARQDAANRVAVNRINIRYYEQQKGIAQQEADIRFIHSTGIRRAQDEINKTLTPLYVQWEAIQAELSGKNSLIYIPVGANGVPLVSTTPLQSTMNGTLPSR